MTNFLFGDQKFYYQIHRQRQKAQGNTPVTYYGFTRRLKKMNLHDAIYNPRAENQVRDIKGARAMPIQDSIRRIQTLKQENVPILDFKYMKMVEKKNLQKKKSKIEMPKPKKTLLERIVLFFTKK